MVYSLKELDILRRYVELCEKIPSPTLPGGFISSEAEGVRQKTIEEHMRTHIINGTKIYSLNDNILAEKKKVEEIIKEEGAWDTHLGKLKKLDKLIHHFK